MRHLRDATLTFYLSCAHRLLIVFDCFVLCCLLFNYFVKEKKSHRALLLEWDRVDGLCGRRVTNNAPLSSHAIILKFLTTRLYPFRWNDWQEKPVSHVCVLTFSLTQTSEVDPAGSLDAHSTWWPAAVSREDDPQPPHLLFLLWLESRDWCLKSWCLRTFVWRIIIVWARFGELLFLFLWRVVIVCGKGEVALQVVSVETIRVHAKLCKHQSNQAACFVYLFTVLFSPEHRSRNRKPNEKRMYPGIRSKSLCPKIPSGR